MALEKLPELSENEKALAKEISLAFEAKYVGKKNAISNSEICNRLELKKIIITEPTLRKIIYYLRSIGKPICSGSKGYWWAANKSELVECATDLKSRIEAQMTTLEHFKKLIEKHG